MANCGIGEAIGTWAARRTPLLACERPLVTIATSARRPPFGNLEIARPADAVTPDWTGQTADFKGNLQLDVLTCDE